jgi:hypothetical protein
MGGVTSSPVSKVERRNVLAVVVILAAVLGPALVVVGLGLWGVVVGTPSERTLRDLQAEGQALAEAAERHRVRTGRYPATLAEAGVSTPLTRYGWWRYGSDGDSFTLELGDYQRFAFQMYYDGDGWKVDT